LIDGQYSIRDDGKILMPFLGEIKAVGLTPAELQAVINDRLSQPVL